jgi:DNA mismatch repair protein MLH1
LRKRLVKKIWTEMQTNLRSACFVGVVSHHRSLIQCQQHVILMNHYECAKELFYQLALTRFGVGGRATAQCRNAIDVAAVVGHCVQLEEDLQRQPRTQPDDLSAVTLVSDINKAVGEQVAACLMDHAPMLNEYFSIVFQKDIKNRVVVTGLPVLLDRFEPFPHGLPLFLLRLATEVDWTEEKPCFHGVCRELGAYYAELPFSRHELGPFVRHCLFPAITTLLIPPLRMKEDDCFVPLTNLHNLYKVFERC